MNAKKRVLRINCVYNVKCCQWAFTVWANDRQGQLPMAVSNDFGGSLEWTAGGNAFRHFQVISNELLSPLNMSCPAETRQRATNFTTDLKNETISYFVGIDAKKSDPRGLLLGDRNITNGLLLDHTILTLETGQSAGWNSELHNQCGNVALMDGSVQQLSNRNLQRMLKETGVWTNRLALPE